MTAPTSARRLLDTGPLPPALHRAVWKHCRWQPHELQSTVLLDPRRQRLLSAGRRAGKSQVGGYALVAEAFRAQGELAELRSRNLRREYWIVGPEYSDAEKEFRVAWDALTLLGFPMDKPGSYNNPLSGEMRISMFNGRFIVWAKSAKYPGTLVGEGLSGVVFSEAAKLKPSIYNKFIRPTLADFGGWSLFGSTPEGRNWFYDFWAIGQDPARKDWGSWRAPSWVNPYVYPGGCDEELLQSMQDKLREGGPRGLAAFMRSVKQVQADMGLVPVGIDPEIFSLFSDMSGEMFNQEIRALFTEYVGRVFKDFDEEVHVTDQELRSDWKTFACADYGFTNPFVWLLLQVSPFNDRVHVVAEYYERNKTPTEAAREIEERGLNPRGAHRVQMFYPDPSEPGRTRDLSSFLQVPFGGGTGTLIADRVEWIRRFLKTGPDHLELWHPERKPYLTFHRRCVNAIREMGAYRYKETAEQASSKGRAAPENPLKQDDHAPEALGRFFSGYYGSPWQQAGGMRVGKIRVGR